MSTEINLDATDFDFAWELANSFAQTYSVEWEGRQITSKDADSLKNEIEQRIIGLFQSINGENQAYYKIAIYLAWLGTDPEKRPLIERQIEQLVRLPDGRYVGVGWFKDVKKSIGKGVSKACDSIGEFWEEHKVAIVVATTAIAILTVIILTAGTAGAGGGAAATVAGKKLDDIFNGKGETKEKPASTSTNTASNTENTPSDLILADKTDEQSEAVLSITQTKPFDWGYTESIPTTPNPFNIPGAPSPIALPLNTNSNHSIYSNCQNPPIAPMPVGFTPSPFSPIPSLSPSDLKTDGPNTASLFKTAPPLAEGNPITGPGAYLRPKSFPNSLENSFPPLSNLESTPSSGGYSMPDPKPNQLLDAQENYFDELKLLNREREEAEWKEHLIDQKEKKEIALLELEKSQEAWENNQTTSRQFPTLGPRNGHLLISGMNGINTTAKEAKSHQAYLRSLLPEGYGVDYTYNQTNGIFADLGEVFAFNYHGYSPNTADLLKEEWRQFHEANKNNPHAKIFKTPHSQGAIDVYNALVTSPKEIRDRVIVVAIAPAKVIPTELCYESYNYASKKDIVHYGELVSIGAFDTNEFITSPNLQIALEHHEQLILLDPHPDVALLDIDHGFQSPTFMDRLNYHLRDYIEHNGEYK